MKELKKFRQFLNEGEQTNEGFLDSIFAPEKKVWRQFLQRQADQDGDEEEDPMDHFDFLPPGQLDAGYAEMIHMISSEDGIRNHPKIDAFIKSIAQGREGTGSRRIRAKYQELKNQLNEELNEEEINEEKALSVQIKPIPVTLTREDFDTDEEWDEFVEMLRGNNWDEFNYFVDEVYQWDYQVRIEGLKGGPVVINK